MINLSKYIQTNTFSTRNTLNLMYLTETNTNYKFQIYQCYCIFIVMLHRV